MNYYSKESLMVYEEVKTTKFFLWVFYFLLFTYDLFSYYIFPYYSNTKSGFPERGIGFYFHGFLLCLLPIAIYLFKNHKTHMIKYLYMFGFIIIDSINVFMLYYDSQKEFTNGHILEVYFILFSPIFLNKRYFWVVSSSFIIRYMIFGLLLQETVVLFPILLFLFLSVISWVFLSRFDSYMKALISVNDNLRQQERLAIVGRMSTVIAHEIKNPLSTLKGFTQLQQESEKDSDNFYPIMLNEIDRINSIVNDLLVLGKPSNSLKTENNISDTLKYVVSIMNFQAEKREIDIKLEVSDLLPAVVCDENQLKQVFINLIKNSIEAIPESGKITISAAPEGSNITIQIKDTGDGIPEDQLAHLFEPFFTTKETGTGLGLLVTKKIIEEHQGEIRFESKLGAGTLVEITLPVNK